MLNGLRGAADETLKDFLSAYQEDGFDRVNPSILKSAVQALYPDFTERQVGLISKLRVFICQMEMPQLSPDGLVGFRGDPVSRT